jgi:hypothetical protein
MGRVKFTEGSSSQTSSSSFTKLQIEKQTLLIQSKNHSIGSNEKALFFIFKTAREIGPGGGPSVRPWPAVRSTTLFKLENRNWKRLVQKPNWTRVRGKGGNVYSGTRTFWFFSDQTNKKVRVPEYAFSLLPLNLVQFDCCTNLVQFRFPA